MMAQEKPKIIEDQMKFFNENAALVKPDLVAPFFLEYVNKEQTAGFAWLADREHILDYGCGTGTSINAFFKANPHGKNLFSGVDIADVAIQKIKQRYPNFFFYTIENNRIPQLPDGSMDGAYLLHVLHHSHEHEAIFREIYAKLRPGGKFFLSDLSSNNPIIKLFRSLYVLAPRFVTQKFADDLVVDGAIPEKYKVEPGAVVVQLKAAGFSVQEVNYGHLFLFCFSWLDHFVPLSRFAVFRALYSALWAIEGWMLKFHFFQKNSEVFCIKCVK